MEKIPVYQIDDFEHSEAFFYANDLSLHILDHGFINKAHKHDFHLAVLFTGGSGTHEVDFTTYPVGKGGLFFLAPGQMHRWQLSRDIQGYIFFHSPEFYNVTYATRRISDFPFFSMPEPSPFVSLGDEELPFTETLFTKIVNEYKSDNTEKFSLLGALINLVYLQSAKTHGVAKSQHLSHSPVYLHKLHELLQLIDRHYQALKYPKEYADLLNVSTKHLNRVCRETVNKTTGELISSRIILEAKRLLAQQGKTVNEIADLLGFDDPSYFIRFFKKQEGESPAIFQRKHR